MQYIKYYYTKNWEHASLLLSMGRTLEFYFREKGKTVFVFRNEFTCQNVIDNYLNNGSKVDAASLFAAIKTIWKYLYAD